MEALAVSGPTIYAGGYFTAMGGQTRNNLAAIGTDGDITTWNPGADGYVKALAVTGSTVYVGGFFTTVGGQPRENLAAIDADGNVTTWSPASNGTVQALAVTASTIYAGGWFTSLAGQSRNYLAAVATDGTLASWDPSVTRWVYKGKSSGVYALALAGPVVYAGGHFSSTGETTNGATFTPFFAGIVGEHLPGAPTNVAATPANAGATVAWTAAGYTGTGITGYKLESAPGPNYDAWSTRIADTGSTATTASISGLTNGTNYRVRVTALASGGAGGTSIASQWFTPNLPTLIPDAPTGIGATPGNSSLTLTWNPPANWGSGASGRSYRGFVFSGGVLVKFCNVNVPATSCLITGLANGSPYTVSVRSFNTLGKYSVIPAQAGPYSPTN